jgi:hypothetical protein
MAPVLGELPSDIERTEQSSRGHACGVEERLGRQRATGNAGHIAPVARCSLLVAGHIKTPSQNEEVTSGGTPRSLPLIFPG